MQAATKNKNYYELLEINQNASMNEIRKAYYVKIREFSNETHPEEFQLLTKAYKTLSDEDSRKHCDHDINNNGAYTKLFKQAMEAMNKDNYTSAIQLLKNMLQSYPKDIAIQQHIASCYLSLENYEEAKRILLVLEKSDSDDEETLDLMGQTYYGLKNFHQAKDYYQRLIQANPNEVNYYLNLSDIYFNLNELHQSLKILEDKLKQGIETVSDFPLLRQMYFITMVKDDESYHKSIIVRIKSLPKNSEEKMSLLRMLIDICGSISNDNNAYKELVHLVKDINSYEFQEVNEWVKEAESHIRSDLIYYGDPRPANYSSTHSTNTYQPVEDERGSILFSIFLGIVASFIFTPFIGIIIGFLWYYNAMKLKKMLGVLAIVAIVVIILGVMILSKM
ncbi:MAG: tetratricopeptide repeat protein [Bacillota bacterium]|nr:tetratricopeptide repeat protein [Bacillota bacterium]